MQHCSPLFKPAPCPASAYPPPRVRDGPSRSAVGSLKAWPARADPPPCSPARTLLLALHPPLPHSTVSQPPGVCPGPRLTHCSWTLLRHQRRRAPCQFSLNLRAEHSKAGREGTSAERGKPHSASNDFPVPPSPPRPAPAPDSRCTGLPPGPAALLAPRSRRAGWRRMCGATRSRTARLRAVCDFLPGLRSPSPSGRPRAAARRARPGPFPLPALPAPRPSRLRGLRRGLTGGEAPRPRPRRPGPGARSPARPPPGPAQPLPPPPPRPRRLSPAAGATPARARPGPGRSPATG